MSKQPVLMRGKDWKGLNVCVQSSFSCGKTSSVANELMQLKPFKCVLLISCSFAYIYVIGYEKRDHFTLATLFHVIYGP